MNSDFRELLELLNAGDVRYLVVGGYAVIKYSQPRYTGNIDIWVEASPDIGLRVYDALTKFGGPISSLTPADFSTEGFLFQMGPLRTASIF